MIKPRSARIAPLALSITLSVLANYPLLAAAVNDDPAPHNLATTLRDQEAVSVTVYNDNLGLVKDTQRLILPSGLTELRFSDVAAKITPETVLIKSLTSPAQLQVLDQNYDYDLLTPSKLLEKFVGKEIKVLKDGVEVPITILSTNEGFVYKLGGRIFTGQPSNLIFPSIPSNLISRPTLLWSLENRSAGQQKLEAAYLTRGLNWKADYVAILDSKNRNLDLFGWVTLDNQSGATYENAQLKLVAGNVNRAPNRDRLVSKMAALRFDAAVQSEAQFTQETFFEYHLYSLQHRTTIQDQQAKQVSLLSADHVPVTKTYFYHGAPYYYRSRLAGPLSDQKAGVYVQIANKAENHLGMPLPKGALRVYKADSDGSLQFVGEDHIDHTPKDETVNIKLGDAFDVVAERKQTDWVKISDHVYEAAFEITLRNHKDEPITVSVIEPMPLDWQVLKNSHPYVKTDAHTVRFDIPVAKDGETTLQYRVRYKF